MASAAGLARWDPHLEGLPQRVPRVGIAPSACTCCLTTSRPPSRSQRPAWREGLRQSFRRYARVLMSWRAAGGAC
eukprot:scaffold347_cov380-Prasinococcus_capsulatus_cf.AAC.22